MTTTTTKYQLVTTDLEVKEALEVLKNEKLVAIDLETTGLNPRKDKIRLLQIKAKKLDVYIFDWFAISNGAKVQIKAFLESPVMKIFQNAKFDMGFLWCEGIEVREKIYDTMLAAQVLEAGLAIKGFGLGELVKRYLNRELPKELQKSDWSGELSTEQLEYAANDVEVILPLLKSLLGHLRESDLIRPVQLEFSILPAVVEMELSGMPLSRKALQALQQELQEQKAITKDTLLQYFPEGVNWNSPSQVLAVLRMMGHTVKGTSEDALKPLAQDHEEIEAFLSYKKITKAEQFTKSLEEHIDEKTGRVYSKYHQMGSVGGRFSCSNLNLQQIPNNEAFRKCFAAGAGKVLVIADYSQIELRIAAEISSDRSMIQAYQNGADLHSLTASIISGLPIQEIGKKERSTAKAVNFGLLYGMGASSLVTYAYNSYNVKMTLKEAERFRQKFFQKYKGLARWHARVGNQKVWETRTLGDRRRQWDRKPPVTQLANSPVQGTGADILKSALAQLPPLLKPFGAKLLGTIHDEIILECEEDVAEKVAQCLKDTMEGAGREYLFEVPVVADVSVAKTWAEKA